MLFEALPELSKEPKITERVKSVSAELIEIKIVISKELNSEIEMLMKLDSHRNPKQSIALLLESLVKEELKREEKKRGKKDESKKEEFKKIKEQSRNSPDIEMKPAAGRTKKLQSELGEDQETFLQEVQNLENHTHDFPTEVKRIVWVRAKGKCEFQNCESSYQLQYDHIKPKALGGTSELENCRLLCRAHNIFVATQAFGREQMGRFVAGMKIAS